MDLHLTNPSGVNVNISSEVQCPYSKWKDEHPDMSAHRELG